MLNKILNHLFISRIITILIVFIGIYAQSVVLEGSGQEDDGFKLLEGNNSQANATEVLVQLETLEWNKSNIIM